MKYGKGVTEKVVSTKKLKELMYFDSNKDVAKFLREQGYTKHLSRVNIKGDFHYVWYKGINKTTVAKLFRQSMA